MSRRSAVLVVVLVLLGLGVPVPPAHAAQGGLRWSGSPVAASAASRTECADVLFLAARGSLEEGPYGSLITAWRDKLAADTAAVPGRGIGTVREVFVDYPALSPETMLDAGLDQLFFAQELPTVPYLESVATGVAHAQQVLDDSARRCPDERWVLVGYSQGAQVMTEVLASRKADSTGQLLLAMLFGNPTHYPGQSVTEAAGDAKDTATGLAAALHYIRYASAVGRIQGEDHAKAAGVQAVLELGQGRTDGAQMAKAMLAAGFAVPPGLADRTLSLCNSGDPVCDAGPLIHRVLIEGGSTDDLLQQAWEPHHRYQPDDVRSVVGRSAAELRAVVPSAPLVTPPPGPPLTATGILAGAVIVALLAGLGVALFQLARRRPRSSG